MNAALEQHDPREEARDSMPEYEYTSEPPCDVTHLKSAPARPRDDGGPAFPYSALAPGGPHIYDDSKGMTLRDYFAARSLMGYRGSQQYAMSDAAKLAEWAYEDADAMLTERNKS